MYIIIMSGQNENERKENMARNENKRRTNRKSGEIWAEVAKR